MFWSGAIVYKRDMCESSSEQKAKKKEGLPKCVVKRLVLTCVLNAYIAS